MIELAQRVVERAQALGFDAVGFARADEPLRDDFERYRAFIDAGMHGGMSYLARHLGPRRNLNRAEIQAQAKTVISVARGYARAHEDERGDPPLAQLIARYARGQDYHRVVRRPLEQLAGFVRSLRPGTAARALCDTAPVLERAWAARAGIGFVGHSGMLIVPGLGSFVLLGEVVTTLDLDVSAWREARAPTGETDALPVADGQGCGACVRCLEACPTQALVAPRVLDPRRCLSYLTIEHRADVPPAWRAARADRLFGCDRCQEVCPYNHAPTRSAQDVGPFRPLACWASTSLVELVLMDEHQWRSLVRLSALSRVPAWAAARNALLVAHARAAQGEADPSEALQAGLRHPDERVQALARQLAYELAPPRNPMP